MAESGQQEQQLADELAALTVTEDTAAVEQQKAAETKQE
jgi:hypothetical protein